MARLIARGGVHHIQVLWRYAVHLHCLNLTRLLPTLFQSGGCLLNGSRDEAKAITRPHLPDLPEICLNNDTGYLVRTEARAFSHAIARALKHTHTHTHTLNNV